MDILFIIFILLNMAIIAASFYIVYYFFPQNDDETEATEWFIMKINTVDILGIAAGIILTILFMFVLFPENSWIEGLFLELGIK